MIKINVSGLAAKEIVNKVIETGGDKVEAHVLADITAVKEVAQGKADYFLGACATGAGGALSMAIAILGYSNCLTVSTAGKTPKEAEIQQAVQSGKKAFGFSCDHVDTAVPLIVKAILAKNNTI